MADVGQIVLSLLPANAEVKVPPAEASSETAVQVDFFSLLSGQLSNPPDQQIAQAAVPVEATEDGKSLPPPDDGGNLIPVALLAPPVAPVPAVLVKVAVEGQSPQGKKEAEETSNSASVGAAGMVAMPVIVAPIVVQDAAPVAPVPEKAAVSIPTDVAAANSSKASAPLPAETATLASAELPTEPAALLTDYAGKLDADTPPDSDQKNPSQPMPTAPVKPAVTQPQQLVIDAPSKDKGEPVILPAVMASTPLSQLAKEAPAREVDSDSESDTDSSPVSIKSLLPDLGSKPTHMLPTDGGKQPATPFALVQEHPLEALPDRPITDAVERQSSTIKDLSAILDQRTKPVLDRSNGDTPLTALASGAEAPEKPEFSQAVTASHNVNTPVALNQPGWEQALAQRIVYQVNQASQSAQISLHPPELGKLDVHVELLQDQANISFTSAHGAVRDAIEAAVPRLREMLADSGMVLVNVNVSSGHSFAQSNRYPQENVASNGGVAAESRIDSTVAPRASASKGLLDLYA